jgi:hypothetical protein
LEQEFPFHNVNKPFCIEIIQELFFKTAIDKQGIQGAFPKTPFLQSSFPLEK